MAEDPTPLAKLEELLAAIRGYDDPRRASAEWKQVYETLKKTGLEPRRFQGIVGMRDVASLTQFIEQLRNPGAADEPAEAPDEETCKRALRAFRKRAKLTRLDDESKLGRGPLSKGAGASSAITPPAEWPNAVWQELTRQRKLRYVGHGFYELPGK